MLSLPRTILRAVLCISFVVVIQGRPASAQLPIVQMEVVDGQADEYQFDPGCLRIVRMDSSNETSLAVYCAWSGSALKGLDYSSLASPMVIPAGEDAIDIFVKTKPDYDVDPGETAVLTILPRAEYVIGGQNSGTVTIGDEQSSPRVWTYANQPSFYEFPRQYGYFVVQRSVSSPLPLAVWFRYSGTAVKGVDFSAPGPAIQIEPHKASASVRLTARDDEILEGDETIRLDLRPDPAYRMEGQTWTSMIMDDNEDSILVRLVPSKTRVYEGYTNVATIQIIGPETGQYAVGPFALTFSGTATKEVDYRLYLKNSVCKPSQPALYSLATLADSLIEEDETIIITVRPSPQFRFDGPDSVTITLRDGRAPG